MSRSGHVATPRTRIHTDSRRFVSSRRTAVNFIGKVTLVLLYATVRVGRWLKLPTELSRKVQTRLSCP